MLHKTGIYSSRQYNSRNSAVVQADVSTNQRRHSGGHWLSTTTSTLYESPAQSEWRRWSPLSSDDGAVDPSSIRCINNKRSGKSPHADSPILSFEFSQWMTHATFTSWLFVKCLQNQHLMIIPFHDGMSGMKTIIMQVLYPREGGILCSFRLEADKCNNHQWEKIKWWTWLLFGSNGYSTNLNISCYVGGSKKREVRERFRCMNPRDSAASFCSLGLNLSIDGLRKRCCVIQQERLSADKLTKTRFTLRSRILERIACLLTPEKLLSKLE